MGILPLKKRVNRDKCSFATKQRMFGVFAIDEILRYRGSRIPGSPTLCHPVRHSSLHRGTDSQKHSFMMGIERSCLAKASPPICRPCQYLFHRRPSMAPGGRVTAVKEIPTRPELLRSIKTSWRASCSSLYFHQLSGRFGAAKG